MAGRFEDVLKFISDEQERQAMVKVLEKNPEAKKALEQVEKLANDGQEYLSWRANPQGFQQYDNAFKNLPTVRKELEAANKIIADLKAGTHSGGDETLDLGNMTLDQVTAKMEERLRAQGFVTKAEAEQLAMSAAAKAKADVYSHGLLQVESMEDAKRNYEKEFGKTLDRSAFGEFITKGKYGDINQAYKDFTADDRMNKIKADAFAAGQKDGADKKAEELAKLNAESAMRGLPVDMNGSNGFISKPGEAPTQVDLKDIPGNYQMGQRGGFKLAHAVAAKIEADRAAGKLQQ